MKWHETVLLSAFLALAMASGLRAAADAAKAAPDGATNVVMLTDSEVGLVNARRAQAEARKERAAKRESLARVRTLAAKSGVPTAVAEAPKVVMPTVVSNRRRLLSMDAESVPGKVVYTYAQGPMTWCETNDVKALTYRVAKRRYSKLKIIVAAKAAGKWDALKAGIRAAGLEDEWLACQYVEDGDPAFVGATNAVVAAGVATAEEIAAFLDGARDN